MLWLTLDSDDSDDNDTNNNNLKADFELYRNGDGPELDHILEILNDDDSYKFIFYDVLLKNFFLHTCSFTC